MPSLLLAIIYLAFISLGLPDSLLGSGWPAMYRSLEVPLSFAGIITFIISCGTVVSSLLSDRVTRRFGAGKVTAFSVLITALSLLGFSFSGEFWMLCLLAIPYGLGAGGVDAALNNYVALHYSSRHMQWLHCMWGVGITISPYIMSRCLSLNFGWQTGYRSVFAIQILLTAILFLSLPLWSRNRSGGNAPTESSGIGLRNVLCVPGVRTVLVGFFFNCALESTALLWACSYLVIQCGYAPALAAGRGALLFAGVLIGRFLSGFISNRVGDRNMIRAGSMILFCGILLLMIPSDFAILAGLLLIGLGNAPIYPSIIHATPSNFGEENSQAIVGLQMAGAYIGATITPPLFGYLAQHIGMWVFPYFLLFFIVPMFFALERLNRIITKQKMEKV